MKFEENKDYVVAYSAKLVINKLVFIGLKNYFITVPKIIKEGVGFTVTTKRFFVGNGSIETAIENLLSDQEMTENKLIKTIQQWGIPNTVVENIAELQSFKIKNSWLDKSIIIKKKENKGWTPLCHSLGKAIQQIENFYK